MYRVQTLNQIAAAGLARLPQNRFQVENDAEAPDAILVRSASLHEKELPDSLLAIARAGAGVNNIPLDRCSEKGIVVFNTPGANSGAVAELTIGALIMGSRNLTAANAWLNGLKGKDVDLAKEVEKGKKQFVGPELYGKKLGVIGLGAIGVKVANDAVHLGMEVYGYDPYISVEAAWNLSRSVVHCVNLSEVLSKCDYLTLHIPVTPQTKGFLNASAFASMKEGARLLNYARGELVDEAALLDALDNGKLAGYFTDFPTQALLGRSDVMCTPHLGASTPESEENCAVMAADELRDYLLNGNIRNSVNMPNASLERMGACRLCVIHRNVPNMINSVLDLISARNINIEHMINKPRGGYAYTMIDLAEKVNGEITGQIQKNPDVLRVRVI